MNGPVNYSHLCQTVTVYRKTDAGIVRVEIPGCFLHWQEKAEFTQSGERKERKFLLVQPGTEQLVFPGDRVWEGDGPVVTEENWDIFIPALIPGLGEVNYAATYYWQGQFCHTEAGRK